jgi:hypothetical protein
MMKKLINAPDGVVRDALRRVELAPSAPPTPAWPPGSGPKSKTSARTGVEDKRWEPQMDAAARDEAYRCWEKAVERTFDWLD